MTFNASVFIMVAVCSGPAAVITMNDILLVSFAANLVQQDLEDNTPYRAKETLRLYTYCLFTWREGAPLTELP